MTDPGESVITVPSQAVVITRAELERRGLFDAACAIFGGEAGELARSAIPECEFHLNAEEGWQLGIIPLPADDLLDSPDVHCEIRHGRGGSGNVVLEHLPTMTAVTVSFGGAKQSGVAQREASAELRSRLGGTCS